jgi:hypothetical protein
MARSFASPIGLLVIVLALGASILVKLAPVGAEATAGGNTSNLQEEARTPTEVVRLFNGKDLSNWETWLRKTGRQDPQRVFRVTDGLLHITGEDHGYIATPQSWKDYHLVVEFKWGKETFGSKYVRNSGILLHARGPHGNAGGVWMASIECQLAQGCVGDLIAISGKDEHGKPLPVEFTSEVVLGPDKRPRWKPGGEKRTFTRGQLWWNQHDPEFKELIDTRGRFDVESPLGEWTRVECICRGDTITIRVNGHTVNHCFQAKPSAGQDSASIGRIRNVLPSRRIAAHWKRTRREISVPTRADETASRSFIAGTGGRHFWTMSVCNGPSNVSAAPATPTTRICLPARMCAWVAETPKSRFVASSSNAWPIGDSPEPERKPRWDTEVVATAAFLAMHDALTTGKLHPLTRQALDRMWTLQKPEGHWNWLKCDWPPAEHDDYYGRHRRAHRRGNGSGELPRHAASPSGHCSREAVVSEESACQPASSRHVAVGIGVFPGIAFARRKTADHCRPEKCTECRWWLGLAEIRGMAGTQVNGEFRWKDQATVYATGFVVYVLRQAGVSREDAGDSARSGLVTQQSTRVGAAGLPVR